MLISKNSIIIEVKNKKYKWELYIGALTIFIYNTRALRSNKVSLLTLQEKKKKSTVGVLGEKVFLEISENSQESTCARFSFLIKLQALDCNFF